MRKKIIPIIAILLNCFLSVAQVNLVPNGSFEEFNTCPDQGFSEISMANGWINPTGYSPDYFNSCAPITQLNSYNVPNNLRGYQNAKTGEAYSGLLTMIETNGREYIQSELMESLIEGKKYLVSFYVSLAEKSKYSSNNIGVYFSVNSISSSNLWSLPYEPQISNNPYLNPISDTTNWIKVSDTLIAFGGEKFITLGNFNNDINTDTTHLNGVSNHSYHYIDDISIVCLDCQVGFSEVNIENRINIFPNPASSYLNLSVLDFKIERFTIFNSLGVPIFNEKITTTNGDSYQIDVTNYNSGIYLLHLESEGNLFIKRFIINN